MENIPLEPTPLWISVIVFVLVVLLPILIIYLGVKILRKTYNFRKNAVQIQGKVINVKETITVEENIETTSYQPEFEFEGPNGETLRGETAISSTGRNFPIGSVHTIMVNLDEPGTVHMMGNMPYILGSVILIAGVMVLPFGVEAFLSTI